MESEVIRTEKISKYYNDVHAVEDVSLSVGKGEIYGFLGLNGAGKTTTIRMLLGMIKPSSGAAWILNTKITATGVGLWKHVGSLVETPSAYPELTVRENLEMFSCFHSLPRKTPVDRIMEKLQLLQYASMKAKNLSLGNKQRLGLAKALIHNPALLILDEPSNGLDPAGIHEIRELLSDLALNHGVTIFISSHILSEISRFATRIGIIHNGKLIKELNSDQLEKLSSKRIIVDTADNERATEILRANNYTISGGDRNRLELRDANALSDPARIATILVTSGVPPSLLKTEEEDLEAFFLRTIGMKGGLE